MKKAIIFIACLFFPALVQAQNIQAIGNVVFGNDMQGAPLSSSTTPYLLNVSETAKPGEVINLQGSVFPTATVYLQLPGGSPIQLTVLSASYNNIQAQIPSGIAFGVYQVWAQYQGNNSNVMNVNQARGVRFEYDQVTPGGAFGIFGRNLVLSGSTPEVYFLDSNGNQHMATGISGDAYQLYATAPSDLVPGQPYTVYIANGLGGYGSGMFSQVQDPLTVRAGGADPFNLTVPWASDFVTLSGNVYNIMTDPRITVRPVVDGVTDDRTAIQDALIIASRAANGGVVYLPAGTYVVASSPLQLFSNVVLEGAGPGLTTIVYDTGSTQSYLAYTQGSSIFGIANLSIQNLPANQNKYSSNAVGSISIQNYSGKTQSEFFLENVNFSSTDNTGGNQVMIGGYDNALIKDSTFYSNANVFYLAGNTHLTLLNNNATYHFGRTEFSVSDHPLIMGNTLKLDESYLTTNTESGGIQVSYDNDPAIFNNTIEDLGNNSLDSTMNFGETIMTQDADGRYFRDVGTVSSISGVNVNLASSDNISLPTTFPNLTATVPEVIQIISGPGLGQWRTIVNQTAASVTIDRPWDIDPTGCEYAIGIWDVNNLYAIGNTITNTIKSIEVYDGGVGTVIANNNLSNALGVMVFGQEHSNVTNYGVYGSGVSTFVDPLWNTYINGNTVTDLDNDPVKGKAFIINYFAQVNPQAWGDVILDSETKNNSIVCNVACTGWVPTNNWGGNGQPTGWNGFSNSHPGGSYSALNFNVAGIIGSIYEGNSASGLTGYDFYETPDSDQTIVDTTNMTIPPFTVTTSVSSGGSVSPSGTVAVPYEGSQTFTFTPSSGHQVTNVTVDGTALTGTLPASYTFTNITESQTLAVTFSAIVPYSLSVTNSGTGFGMINGSIPGTSNLINCGVNSGATVCSATVNSLTTVTLTASAASGSFFSGWTVTGASSTTCTGTTTPCTILMNSNTSITANFSQVRSSLPGRPQGGAHRHAMGLLIQSAEAPTTTVPNTVPVTIDTGNESSAPVPTSARIPREITIVHVDDETTDNSSDNDD